MIEGDTPSNTPGPSGPSPSALIIQIQLPERPLALSYFRRRRKYTAPGGALMRTLLIARLSYAGQVSILADLREPPAGFDGGGSHFGAICAPCPDNFAVIR